MAWTRHREVHVLQIVVQLVSAARIMQRASYLMSTANSIVLVLTAICTAYSAIAPIPSIACVAYNNGDACGTLLSITAIAANFVSLVFTLLDGKLEFEATAVQLHQTAKQVLVLARRCDATLQKDQQVRPDVDVFCREVLDEYDSLMQTLPSMPRCMFRRRELLNITLLQAYEMSSSSSSSDDRRRSAVPIEDMLDRFIAENIERAWERHSTDGSNQQQPPPATSPTSSNV